jgi:uncharacterized protein (TIGR03000 family)
MRLDRILLPTAWWCAALAPFLLAPAAGAWEKITPYSFGRYEAPPSIYGWPLDDPTPTYYGGIRYREYYSFGRGYGLANFPGPVPSFNGTYLRHKVWPYDTPQIPGVYHFDPNIGAAYVVVNCPAGAQVWMEGRLSEQTGTTRTFVSPPLPPSQKYIYVVRARWQDGSGRREQAQQVVVQAGNHATVTFPLGTEPQVAPLPQLVAPPAQQ